MPNPALRPKIGLLALTLELYETLAPALRASREAWLRRELLPALGKTCEVVFSQAVFRREAIEAATAEFETAGAEAILVILLTYSPSQLALPALQRTRLPLAIWNTQELFAVDAAFTLEQMIDNHGVHGTQDLGNVLTRAGVPFHYVTSHPRDVHALAELNAFFTAAAACRRLAPRPDRPARLPVSRHGRLRPGHHAAGGDVGLLLDPLVRRGLYRARRRGRSRRGGPIGPRVSPALRRRGRHHGAGTCARPPGWSSHCAGWCGIIGWTL